MLSLFTPILLLFTKKNPNELDHKSMKVKPCYAIGIGMRHIEINYMTTGCDILVFR